MGDARLIGPCEPLQGPLISMPRSFFALPSRAGYPALEFRNDVEWVKKRVALRHNLIWRKCSDLAKVVYDVALMTAADNDQIEGDLATRIGPMGLADIATECYKTEKSTKAGLDELVAAGLLGVRDDGGYFIHKFTEKAGPKSSAKRVRAWRERNAPSNASRNADVTVTRNDNSNAIHGRAHSSLLTLDSSNLALGSETTLPAREDWLAGDDPGSLPPPVPLGDSIAEQFCAYVLRRGVQFGFINGSDALDDGRMWIRQQRAMAEQLLAANSIDVCMARAEAMFEARRRKKYTGTCTVVDLRKVWDWGAIAAVADEMTQRQSPETTGNSVADDMMRRLKVIQNAAEGAL